MPLVLKHTPGEWDGTFANTQPIGLYINGELETRKFCQYTGGDLFFADGARLNVLEIDKVEVP